MSYPTLSHLVGELKASIAAMRTAELKYNSGVANAKLSAHTALRTFLDDISGDVETIVIPNSLAFDLAFSWWAQYALHEPEIWQKFGEGYLLDLLIHTGWTIVQGAVTEPDPRKGYPHLDDVTIKLERILT